MSARTFTITVIRTSGTMVHTIAITRTGTAEAIIGYTHGTGVIIQETLGIRDIGGRATAERGSLIHRTPIPQVTMEKSTANRLVL